MIVRQLAALIAATASLAAPAAAQAGTLSLDGTTESTLTAFTVSAAVSRNTTVK